MITMLMIASIALTVSSYEIPADKLDETKIYYGTPTRKFDKVAEVNFEEVLKCTPEYKQIKRDKVTQGSGKYWILLSQGSDRTVKAIAEVAKDFKYEIIASSGYMQSINIYPDSITSSVIDKVKGSEIVTAKK